MKFKTIQQPDPGTDSILPVFHTKTPLTSVRGVTIPEFSGESGSHRFILFEDGTGTHLVGLGDQKKGHRVAELIRKWAYASRKEWKPTMQVDCRNLPVEQTREILLGLSLSSYEIGFMKTDHEKSSSGAIINVCSGAVLDEVLQSISHESEAINRVKKLVDTPSNHKTPEFLAGWARQSADAHGYTFRVIEGAELEKMGFHAVLAVGGGSKHTPRVIELQYEGKQGKPVDVGLVGKGITFDSGGISIKPSQNMHYMKSDMGGAAAVLGAVELAARWELPVNIVGVVAAAENAVDANSFRPGDVIQSYSGKTIEVIDTDAEGRLVLADAISYIIDQHTPTYLLDLATLTGSVVRTLGYSAAGVFSTNTDLIVALRDAGAQVNERIWPLPMYEDFEEDLHSDIADLKNLSDKPVAGAITAAKFLEAFTRDHTKWAHLDIAGMAFGSNEYAKMKSATGYGVRLITSFLKSLTTRS